MREQLNKATKRQHFEFDSLNDVARFIDTAPRTWKAASANKESRRHSWDLGVGFSEAVELARLGWIEGANRAQDTICTSFTHKSPAPDTKVDFYGHMPHVPRYCAGAPDSMLRHTTPPTIGGGRVITLYVSCAIHAEVRAQNAANFGLGVAAYINQLETDGVRVELYATSPWDEDRLGKKGWRVSFAVKLKSADQPLDLAVIAFALGHPAMTRRIIFALMERCAAPNSPHYMFPKDTKQEDILDFPAHGYILNGIRDANSTSTTPQDALEAVEREINKAIEQLEGVT